MHGRILSIRDVAENQSTALTHQRKSARATAAAWFALSRYPRSSPKAIVRQHFSASSIARPTTKTGRRRLRSGRRAEISRAVRAPLALEHWNAGIYEEIRAD
jgi:hypothetical protein